MSATANWQSDVLFDPNVLKCWAEIDDPEKLRAFYEAYLDHTASQLAILKGLDQSMGGERGMQVAHQLKSSSATVGATRLAALLAVMEKASEENDVNELYAVRKDLFSCWEATVSEMREHIRKLT